MSVITDYINFCISCTIPIKTVRRYPNSKPWITYHIKSSLREKHKAFQRKDWTAFNSLNRQIKMDIIKAKHKYKDRLEQDFRTMNAKQAFHKVKILTGQSPSKAHSTITDPTTFAATLNSFYTRFDTQNYSATCEELLNAFPPDLPEHSPVTTVEVQQQLSRCKAGKAPGPDNISAKVLKLCAMSWPPLSIPSSGNHTGQHPYPTSAKLQPSSLYPRNHAPLNQITAVQLH